MNMIDRVYQIIKLIIFCCVLALTQVSCQNPTNHLTKHQMYVFGTLVEINLWTENPDTTQNAIDEISSTFNVMHHQWHAWKPGRLAEINLALRSSQSIILTIEEQLFIEKTIELTNQSEHHFNPTIGELINIWGFHTDDYPILTPPPSNQQIQHLIAKQISVDNLTIKGSVLSSDNHNMWLDFGGIAKGYAIDRAVEILNKHGIYDAIINAGGDLRSVGSKGKIPWRVAIQSPSDWSMLAELVITGDESIFTSGNYQRYKEFSGKRYSHIINPKTGMPVTNIVSATVIAENGILADAAATALVVAGDQWPQIAKNMHIKQALVINEKLQCLATAAMVARLENLNITCQVVN